MDRSRRVFVAGGLLAGAAIVRAQNLPSPGGPKAIASNNGLAAVEKAVKQMIDGIDTLDAAIAGVNLVEDDPDENTVGLGGLPNEEGVVELDSAVMHGPTAGGGAVASLRNIRNPSRVAKLVMERTDHVLLVGEGALRFARAHGFKEENLLTEKARKIWLRWKETLSDQDDWLPPDDQNPAGNASVWRWTRPTGTIHLSAFDGKGNLSSCTTTSGLAFKIPGRVGDSPILGAGLYTDNDVGSAGSTGRGEANLLTCASFLIVEEMRRGQSPTDACLAACRRISTTTKARRLLDEKGRPRFDVKFYALDKQGRHGSASLYAGNQYALADIQGARLLDCASLYDTPLSSQ
ncbi:MAG: N(4)-(beta-N-acetylglucosaminyl)-L-asparaginase [Planctomycetota bacterium]